MVIKHAIQPPTIFNLDETAVFCDHSKSITAHTEGSKDVPNQLLTSRSSSFQLCFEQAGPGEKKLLCMAVGGPLAAEEDPLAADKDPVAVNNGISGLSVGPSWINAASFVQFNQHLFQIPSRRTQRY